MHERERLKSIFMKTCMELSAVYINRGELLKAEEILRHAAAEPYNETVFLELLKLYISQGKRSKAVKLYYSLKKRLEQEIDRGNPKSMVRKVKILIPRYTNNGLPK